MATRGARRQGGYTPTGPSVWKPNCFKHSEPSARLASSSRRPRFVLTSSSHCPHAVLAPSSRRPHVVLAPSSPPDPQQPRLRPRAPQQHRRQLPLARQRRGAPHAKLGGPPASQAGLGREPVPAAADRRAGRGARCAHAQDELQVAAAVDRSSRCEARKLSCRWLLQ